MATANLPSREDFQIGWVCALPVEAAAAKQMLDEHLELEVDQEASDSNHYTYGRIGRHIIAITRLPGRYGISPATEVATNMARTFPNLRVILMVGLGGGIPSPEHDIRLGDVVIGVPTGRSSGVEQYDLGKHIADGSFQRTGCLNSPPSSILGAISEVKERELVGEQRYTDILE
ncbi:hypothetical protein C1H76_5636 [Elsinoe australis]|uniref:Nucleoside phosphorylase domain-containing protein n=1 Tax=Elsinoe australis TaxID=40998 RepID=A0A4U7AZQ0_9PEZI|nr:hypothetical protein C1H76_5636 [Elsinoe australis]